MNTQILKIIEIVFAILLVLSITFQTKGNALSESVSSAFSLNRTKRGFEKFVFYFTIIIIIAFSINTILLMFIK
jgi:preprotein translocase subunit SecG